MYLKNYSYEYLMQNGRCTKYIHSVWDIHTELVSYDVISFSRSIVGRYKYSKNALRNSHWISRTVSVILNLICV